MLEIFITLKDAGPTTNSKSNPTYKSLWIYIVNIFKPPWIEFPVICIQKVGVIKTQGW